jgi:3-hydroxyacyl-CoA dehydrogenase / enoyl-CoA hydratase / 3-hydroxybutyryl-CoA epimerase
MGPILEKIDVHDDQVGTVQHHKVHWRCSRDADGVAWLTLDQKDADTNTLSTAVLQEFNELLQEIEDDLPKALVIRSAKKNGFCAGVHIGDFKDQDASEISAMLSQGHDMLDRLENLPVPTIAVLHGHCLGGGLELALACAMRIGVKGGLEMGFPEIKLGLQPGLGGTARLTHLIDPTEAMTMMLTGKSVYDGQAKKRGLIDALVEERQVEGAVRAAVAGKLKKKSPEPKG